MVELPQNRNKIAKRAYFYFFRSAVHKSVNTLKRLIRFYFEYLDATIMPSFLRIEALQIFKKLLNFQGRLEFWKIRNKSGRPISIISCAGFFLSLWGNASIKICFFEKSARQDFETSPVAGHFKKSTIRTWSPTVC